MIKSIILILLILKTVYEAFLTYIEIKSVDRKLPENVKDVYNEEEFNNWKAYNKENIHLGIIDDVIEFILNFLLIYFNVYAFIFYFTDVNDYLKYLWLLLIVAIISLILKFPIDYYDTFVIEEKYGMNKSTKLTFVFDKFKSLFLSLMFSFIPIVIIKNLYDRFGNSGAILIILSIVGLSLIIVALVMQILKIFNKFTELENTNLREN